MVDLLFQPESEAAAYPWGMPGDFDRTGRFAGDVRAAGFGQSAPIFGLWPGGGSRSNPGGVTSIFIDAKMRISPCARVDSERRIAHTGGVGRALSSMTGTVCVVLGGATPGGESDGPDESYTSPSLRSVCRSKQPVRARCSSRHCGQLTGHLSCAQRGPRRRVMFVNGRASTICRPASNSSAGSPL